MDKAEVHIVYVLKHKLKVNWPHYVASRIFALKESDRGTALRCLSFIPSILNKSKVSVQGIPYKPVTTNQEFCQKTASLMGYTWDRTTRLYKTRKPVPDSNTRHLEDDYDDEDDDDEEDEDEDDEYEEENNDDNSQPMEHDQQVTDHGDWLGTTPGQHPSDNQGWGERKHTGWTNNRSSYMPTPYSQPENYEVMEMLRDLRVCRISFRFKVTTFHLLQDQLRT